MSIRPAFLAVALGLCVLTATADDWPQWRGPNRDNHVTGFKAPATWPKELTQKWKVTVGEGLASPALVGDKVYVFTRQGGDEVTRCLDAATGKEIWADKYEAVAVTRPADGGGRFIGPRSSPAVADGKVCTLGVGGVVSCLDAATGKVIWRKDTKTKPRFFTSSSPVIAEGVCVVYIGADGKGQLTAFDLATGNEKWKWTGAGPSYGSPVVATIAGRPQVVALTSENLVGVGLADGKLLWQATSPKARYQTSTPVVDGSTVILGGTAITIEKSGDGFAAKPAWKGQASHQYNTPVLVDGRLYGLTGMGASGKLYCQDAKTGMVIWEDSTTRGECGTVLDAGGVLLALTSNSTLVAFKPGAKDYEEVAKYKVAETPTWASPILAGNRLFVKDKDSLILWTIE
jgi:outer membrane protein assembly factor BamB